MVFELGKSYIVEVTEKGIIPTMEFDESQWYNKDLDDLDFLTDEEKAVVVNDVLDKLRAEIESAIQEETVVDESGGWYEHIVAKLDPGDVFHIINKYRVKGSDNNGSN